MYKNNHVYASNAQQIVKVNLKKLVVQLEENAYPSNEVDMLNPLIRLLNKLGYIVVPEPCTREYYSYESRELLLQPDLLILRRMTANHMLAFIIEAKVRERDLKPKQIYRFITALNDFNHILIVPQNMRREVLRIASSLASHSRNICIATYSYKNSLLGFGECSISLATLSPTRRDSRLMVLAKLFASIFDIGPLTSKTIGYGELYAMHNNQNHVHLRRERIEILSRLVDKVPQLKDVRSEIIQNLRFVHHAVARKEYISKLVHKPFASILFHLVYGLSSAELRNYSGYKLPRNFHLIGKYIL